jgi:hypothetical protein
MSEDWYGTTDVGVCPVEGCGGRRMEVNGRMTPPDCSTTHCTGECGFGVSIDGRVQWGVSPEDRGGGGSE